MPEENGDIVEELMLDDGGRHKLKWLVDIIREKEEETPKTMIFVNSINSASSLFQKLMVLLDNDAFKGRKKVRGMRLLSI